MPNHSRKNGNKLTSSSIASRIRKNTMDALLQRQHNLSSKLWIKLEKEVKYGTKLPFRVTSSKKFKNKTFPMYLVILELYPSSSRAQSKEKAVRRKSSSRHFSGGFELAGHKSARQHRFLLYWRALAKWVLIVLCWRAPTMPASTVKGRCRHKSFVA